MKKTAKKKRAAEASVAASTAPAVELPVEVAELVETPDDYPDNEYMLATYRNEASEQLIDLTREEYLGIKGCLLQSRGLITIGPPSVAPEPAPVAAAEPDEKKLRSNRFGDRCVNFVAGEHEKSDCYEYARIGAFLEIMANNRGLTTPFEQFVVNVIDAFVYSEKVATPKLIESELETFRSDFEDAVDMARMIARRHPKLIAADEPEQGQEG